MARETRKVIVETLKIIEYVTKGYIARYSYNIVLNLNQLHSLVPFSSLVL